MGKVALVDIRIPRVAADVLAREGYTVIALPEAEYLASPVAAHPDMLIFRLGDELFCHARYAAQPKAHAALEAVLAACPGLRLTEVNEPTGEKYPCDIIFNAALVGKKLLCMQKNTAHAVLERARSMDIKIIDVKQGYTKCSTVVVDDSSIITADTGIEAAARNAGIDVLSVSPDQVKLDGYEFGFIGGSSGACDGTLYFCGDINLHRDGRKIKLFCAERGVKIVSLTDLPLCDVGSIIFI